MADATITTLFVGKTMTLPIKIYDQNKVLMDALPAGGVLWVSSDPKVATVKSEPDGSGEVFGVAEGKAQVSASVTVGGAIAAPPVAFNVILQIPTTAEIVLPPPPVAAKV